MLSHSPTLRDCFSELQSTHHTNSSQMQLQIHSIILLLRHKTPKPLTSAPPMVLSLCNFGQVTLPFVLPVPLQKSSLVTCIYLLLAKQNCCVYGKQHELLYKIPKISETPLPTPNNRDSVPKVRLTISKIHKHF